MSHSPGGGGGNARHEEDLLRILFSAVHDPRSFSYVRDAVERGLLPEAEAEAFSRFWLAYYTKPAEQATLRQSESRYRNWVRILQRTWDLAREESEAKRARFPVRLDLAESATPGKQKAS